MKINIQNIPEKGFLTESTYPLDFLEQCADDDLVFIEPFKVKTRIDKAQDDLIIKIDVVGKYKTFCSRCLREMEQNYKTQIDLFYENKDKEKDFIDITEDIRQEILLNLPPKILCSKGCKGICPGCGVNLNENQCQCNE